MSENFGLIPVGESSLPYQLVPSEDENVDIRRRIFEAGRCFIGRSALAIGMMTGLVLTGETILAPPVVHADLANDYPDGGAMPYNVSDYDWWMDENGDGEYSGTGELISSRGYYYRNCTDGAAYWVKKYTGVTVPGNLGNAKTWDDKAPGSSTVIAGNSNEIEAGDVAQSDDGDWGHVGFVTSVAKDSDGKVTSFSTFELNKAGDGNFTSNTYSAKNSAGNFKRGSNDWDHFIDFNGVGTGINGEATSGTTPPPKDGTQMILNHAEEIWAKSGVGNGGWTFEAASGSAVDIASGGGVQMILDHAGQVWAQKGIGGNWVQETGPNSAVEIEVGSDGLQLLRDGASQVWAKTGVGWDGWIQETGPGAAKDIETNGGVQVIRNYADQLWVKTTVGWGGWQAESGENGAVEVEVSNDGTQMVRNAAGEVWARANTANSGWVQEAGSGSAAEIAINNGVQILRNYADQVWQKGAEVSWGGWQAETAEGSAVEIAVEDDGTQILRNHADTIYARSTAANSNWVAETGSGAAAAIGD